MACMVLKNCWRCRKKYTGSIEDGCNGLGRCDKCNKEVAALLTANKLEVISQFTILTNPY